MALDKRFFETPFQSLHFTNRTLKVDNNDNYLCLSFRDGNLLFLNPQTLEKESVTKIKL